MIRIGVLPGRLSVTSAPATGRFESDSVTCPKMTPVPVAIGLAGPPLIPSGPGPSMVDVTRISCDCPASVSCPALATRPAQAMRASVSEVFLVISYEGWAGGPAFLLLDAG